MQGFFETQVVTSGPEEMDVEEEECLAEKGKKTKAPRRYVPQKNSVPYALLITLYRGTANGSDFMRKQELIDAAEASGLSRGPIAPEKGKGKASFGSSSREWYSGWSCMKTLITKGLVVKSSNPAKYMLTPEGKEAARECLVRSGLVDSTDHFNAEEGVSDLQEQNAMDLEFVCSSPAKEVASQSTSLSRRKKDVDVPLKSLERKSSSYGLIANMNSLAMPPLNSGERFQDAFEVILILDDREKFSMQRSLSRIALQLKIPMEVRRLPVGDAIWIARHKQLESEYVLDFIVERKNVDDLRCSIRDSRYRDQKLRIVKCGLKKPIYLVEGDLNSSEAAESIKTACFTTEILEGFDVQRTSGPIDTLKKYSYLTQAVTHYYRSLMPEKSKGVCLPFDEFIQRCQDMDKMTIGDVFAIQLMQVPCVTEEVAIAVLDLYPTLLSLAQAYHLLDGDVKAQEAMLWKQTNNVVGAPASKNIYRFVWAT